MNQLHVGIFGPGLCGKTTLAKSIAVDGWRLGRRKSIVLDPNLAIDPSAKNQWGPAAFVTADVELFRRVFWAEKGCLAFIEESSEMIDRDRSQTGFFTRGRHNGHKIIVCGHTGSSMLPVQREQLQTLMLFRQPKSSAKVWAELHAEPRIFQCTELRQYEFLYCRLYSPPEKRKLTLPSPSLTR